MPTAFLFMPVGLPAELSKNFRIFYIITMTTEEILQAVQSHWQASEVVTHAMSNA